MRYCVIKNILSDEQLDKLQKLHHEIIRNPDNFKELIIKFVEYIRKEKPELEKKVYISQILFAANQIVYSFSGYKNAKASPFFSIGNDGSLVDINTDKQPMETEIGMILIFFMNAKAFIDLIKKYTKVGLEDDFYKDIKTIRDYLAHYYEKDIDQRKFFVNLFIERGLREYATLNLHDIDSGELVYEACFSMDIFYFSLKKVFEDIKNNLKDL